MTTGDLPALDPDRQLAEMVARVEDELYGVAPAEFVGRRTDAVRAAKENGDRALADALASMRKPTAAAWILNAFTRERPSAIEALLDLGDRLCAAMERGDGDELRRLARERNGGVAAVMRQIRARSMERGESLSVSVAEQIEQTLRAGLVSPADRERLRRGVLTTMLTDSGVAPMAAVGGVPRPKPDGAEVPRPATAQRRDETATQRLVRAEGAVREATHALDASADRRADLETERDGLERRRAEIDRLLREERDQRSEAEARLRKARSELRAARMTLGRAPTPGAER